MFTLRGVPTLMGDSYPFADPFDSVITATARVMDLPLITKDQQISDSQLVDIYW
jgi:PIN domain nuclease of toxin-antitoxin system